MGADIKNLRTRIKSVGSTSHLTKAMGLVASSKIRRANENMQKSRQYLNAVSDIVDALCASSEVQKSPYMKTNGGKTKIIVIAGDRGLAGGYNANVFRLAGEQANAEFIPIGKRAVERFGGEMNSSETFSARDASELAKTLCEQFRRGEIGRLGIIDTEYVSMMTQNARITWLLPLKPTEERAAGTVFEPNEEGIIDLAVPEYVAGQITASLRESFASEVAARRMAMDSADKNAKKMLDELQLKYNRARQGAITQEITEIVAGASE